MGTSDEGFAEGARDAARLGAPGAGRARHRCSSMFDEPDPGRDPGEPGRVRQRARRPRAELNAALGRLPGVLEVLEPVMREPVLAGDRPRPASSTRSAPPRPRSRRWPRSRRQMFGSLDTTFTALAEVARPFIQESISEGPPTEAVAIETLPRIRPLPRQLDRALRRPRAGRGRPAPDLADDRRRARGRDAGARRRPTSSTTQLAPTAESLLRLTNNAAARAGITAATLAHRPARPGDRVHRPGADGLQLRSASSPSNLNGVFTDGNDARRLAAVHRLRRPQGPEQRGQPVVGDRQRRHRLRRQELPPLEPLPEHRRARADVRVRGRQRAVQGGQQVVFGNPPGNQGTNTKSQDLTPSEAETTPRWPCSTQERPPAKQAQTRTRPCPTRGSTAATTPGPRRGCYGLIVALLIAVGVYLAFAKKLPFTGEGFTAQRAVRERRHPARDLAGADRRRQRRQGDRGRARGRRGARHLQRRRGGPADPRGRDDRDPPAALPRGQLLPRPRPGQPERPGARRRRHDPDHPDRDRGPDRRGADRAPGAGAARACSGRSRASAPRSPTSRRPPTTSARTPTSPGRPGAEALNQSLRYGGPAGPRHGDRQRGAARRGPARPLRR